MSSISRSILDSTQQNSIRKEFFTILLDRFILNQIDCNCKCHFYLYAYIDLLLPIDTVRNCFITRKYITGGNVADNGRSNNMEPNMEVYPSLTFHINTTMYILIRTSETLTWSMLHRKCFWNDSFLQ